MKRDNEGFTLVEIMVVVLILGILLLIAVRVYTNETDKAKAAVCISNRVTVESAAQQFRIQNGSIAPSIASLVGSYIQKAPQCPSQGVYTWVPGAEEVLCSVHYATDDSVYWASDWGNLSQLQTLMGKFTVVDGLLTATGGNQALFKGDTPSDFTMQATLVTLAAGQGYGFYYRASAGSGNTPTGYCFQYDPGLGNKFVVRKVVNGVESAPIAIASMPSGYDIYGKSRNITITAVGDHSVIKVDGQVVLDFSDPTFTSGQVGLRTWNSGSVSVGGVSVSPPPE